MADQALLFGAAGRTDDGEVLSDFEVDYTPPAVAVQMLLALLEEVGGRFIHHRVRNVLDPSAGSGVWGRASRAILGDSARRLVAAAVAIGVDVERLATRLGVEPNGPQTTFAIEDAAARWEIGGAP